jgi:hypothetical protein
MVEGTPDGAEKTNHIRPVYFNIDSFIEEKKYQVVKVDFW